MKKLRPRDLLEILNQRDDVFCHVSTWIGKDNLFEPRIPENLYMYGQEENDEIDRVCVSSTLEGALLAIPQGGEELYNWYEDNGMYFKVYIIDTKKLNIDKEDIYEPEYLVKNDYVLDAEYTGEHWILKPFEVAEEDSFLINVKDWIVKRDDKVFELKDLKITTDFVYKNEIIEIDLKYIEWRYKKDLHLDVEKEKLKLNFLKINPEIEFIDNENEMKIKFIAKKDQSIRKLMEYDSNYKGNLIY